MKTILPSKNPSSSLAGGFDSSQPFDPSFIAGIGPHFAFILRQ
jgi:hypothetical protein